MKSLIVVVAIVLAGCSANTPAPVDSPTEKSSESVYLQVIRDRSPVLDDVSDSVLLEYGTSVCLLFSTGGDLSDVMEASRGTGIPMDISASMAGAALGALCPEYADQL